MKTKILIAVGLAVCLTIGFAQESVVDPVSTFKTLVAKFPHEGVIHSKKTEPRKYSVFDVQFDVKKTDSLLSPVVGLIDFRGEFPIGGSIPSIPFQARLTFHWAESRWIYDKIFWLDAHGGPKDMTHQGFDTDLTSEGPIHEFLAPLKSE